MAQVIWTLSARDDLREVSRFIAQNSKEYAAATVREIRLAATRLATFPESGRIVPDFPDEPFREIIVGPYRVIYRYLAGRDVVRILSVVHASRQLRHPPNGS